MAAFSYQHHHPFHLDSSSVLMPMEEGNFFIYPPKFPTHNQQIIINNPLDGGVFESSRIDHQSDNEPSSNNSAVTNNQSTTVSSTEHVTQSTVTHTNKKRKSRTNGSSLNSAQSKQPREVKVKKQKKSNDAKEKKNPNADEKKVSEEPPKDYIHVRARRGQATDSHSLAERVRREKISERMKILEKLVPGCDKVTGKALVLDEIINYVQHLQNQVEFLSMELASMNPMFYDFGIDLDNTFMVRQDQQRLNSIAASAPLQCSPTTQLTAFAEATTAAAFNPPADHNNNPILDTVLLLQQEQMPNALNSQDNGSSLLWDVEDQKQKFLNPSVFINNLCSFH